VERLSTAWRRSTLKSYHSKVRKFADFCEKSGKSLARATTVDIVNWHAALLTTGLKEQSVKEYVGAVVSMRTHLGIEDDASLLRVTRQALKANGAVPPGPRPTPSLTRLWEHLQVLKERDPLSRKDARGRALVLVRLATLGRAFDLQHWLAASLKFTNEGATVTAERTKCNPTPRYYRIPRVTADDVAKRALCPVAALEHYCALYKDFAAEKYVWRAVTKPFRNITADAIASATKAVLTAAGYAADEIRPHGLRAVGAQLARRGGADLEEVKSAGGWKSWQTMLDYYLHAGDYCTAVAMAIYEAFPEDEASAVEGS